MDKVKRKRGRPLEPGAKRKRINLLVSDEFYEELKELSELDGKTRTDYIIESVRKNGNLTRLTKSGKDYTEELEIYPDGDFMDEEYED